MGASMAVNHLTKSEQEILELVLLGQTSKVIARNRFVEPSTIKFHLTGIYKKLKVKGRHELLGKKIGDLRREIKAIGPVLVGGWPVNKSTERGT